MKPRYVGHDEGCDASPMGSLSPEPFATCDCYIWQCRDCGQTYGENEPHECPARQVDHLDPEDV